MPRGQAAMPLQYSNTNVISLCSNCYSDFVKQQWRSELGLFAEDCNTPKRKNGFLNSIVAFLWSKKV